MITTLWPDGTTIRAPDWEALEDEVRARQWTHYSRAAFRREMRRRARVFAGDAITVPTHSAEAMFRGLEAVDMLRIEQEGGEGDADSDDPG